MISIHVAEAANQSFPKVLGLKHFFNKITLKIAFLKENQARHFISLIHTGM